MQIRRALLSVYDKTAVIQFATALHREFGVELIATGGTARALREAGVPVRQVEDITGQPELLDGRVKTLHPGLLAAILADRDNPRHMRQLAELGMQPIDLVAIDLYPFEQAVADPGRTPEQVLEMIDIGGVTLLRAAAKNFAHVWCLAEQRLWGELLTLLRSDRQGRLDRSQEPQTRRAWAALAFRRTMDYDRAIQRYLSGPAPSQTAEFLEMRGPRGLPADIALVMHLAAPTRYGENPHQVGGCYTPADAADRRPLLLPGTGAAGELSFNNCLDADAAWGLCVDLTRGVGSRVSANSAAPVCVFVKHTNPCGAGLAVPAEGSPEAALTAQIEAYRRAYLGDPAAAMGGILACNFPVTAALATTVMETYERFGRPLKQAARAYAPGGFFVEVWLAPAFDEQAVAIIRGAGPDGPKKNWGRNVRLLVAPHMSAGPDPLELQYRSAAGAVLVQTPDWIGLDEDRWKVVTRRRPAESELADLRLAWLIAKHTKSNAVSLVRDGMLIGNGAGQASRLMSARLAVWLARQNGHGESLRGSVAASDAFFPFPDGPRELIEAGVTAIIQPGGSKRDPETIAACDEHHVAMIFTGTRHLRH